MSQTKSELLIYTPFQELTAPSLTSSSFLTSLSQLALEPIPSQTTVPIPTKTMDAQGAALISDHIPTWPTFIIPMTHWPTLTHHLLFTGARLTDTVRQQRTLPTILTHNCLMAADTSHDPDS